MRRTAIMVSLLCLLPAGTAAQEDRSYERELLVGRPEFEVIVEEFDDEGRTVGLNQVRLRTAIESRFFELEMPLKDGAIPYVYVKVVALLSEEDYVYHATVEFKQIIPGAMGPYHTRFFQVWHADTLGIAARSGAADHVTDAVMDLVDEFANDYLAVNN